MLVAPKSKAGRRTIKLPDALRAHRVHQPEERLAAANIWQDGGSHWGPTPTWSLSWRRRQPIGSGSPCGAERAPLAHTVAQGDSQGRGFEANLQLTEVVRDGIEPPTLRFSVACSTS